MVIISKVKPVYALYNSRWRPYGMHSMSGVATL